VVGLIDDNDETTYREEVKPLAVWCHDNNLSLNVSKTKELIVDYRKWRAEHAPIHIDGAAGVRVESCKFLGVHIAKDHGPHTPTVMKRAQQCLFPLRRLKCFAWALRSSKVLQLHH
jgi:hypothetical protein